jgi:hypothetical protein
MRLVVATGVCGPVDTVLLHIAFKLSHARDGKCSCDGNPVKTGYPHAAGGGDWGLWSSQSSGYLFCCTSHSNYPMQGMGSAAMMVTPSHRLPSCGWWWRLLLECHFNKLYYRGILAFFSS